MFGDVVVEKHGENPRRFRRHTICKIGLRVVPGPGEDGGNPESTLMLMLMLMLMLTLHGWNALLECPDFRQLARAALRGDDARGGEAGTCGQPGCHSAATAAAGRGRPSRAQAAGYHPAGTLVVDVIYV